MSVMHGPIRCLRTCAERRDVSAPPETRLVVAPEEEARIRDAVRRADVSLLGAGYCLADYNDAEALFELLRDPRVSDPIYDLPRPISRESIAEWVQDARDRQATGEAVLAVKVDREDVIVSYSYFTIWPDRSAAEIGGAFRADQQSKGAGKAGLVQSLGWMFDHLGVRLIGVTAAVDNVRSAKVIESAGLREMSRRDSVRPDGTIRQSRYWELSRDEWHRLPRRSA